MQSCSSWQRANKGPLRDTGITLLSGKDTQKAPEQARAGHLSAGPGADLVTSANSAHSLRAMLPSHAVCAEPPLVSHLYAVSLDKGGDSRFAACLAQRLFQLLGTSQKRSAPPGTEGSEELFDKQFWVETWWSELFVWCILAQSMSKLLARSSKTFRDPVLCSFRLLWPCEAEVTW